ncbi:MAG TPA: bifunctional glutamate N-acetyltransferase/amino-acid acetyltransferase ArgJ [Anaerolineales bacterium]|nr:bifunctional glutamate N-acetyltransferase/amino-acid acetyltransferase ArgJ [Anaerolineales bacterium]
MSDVNDLSPQGFQVAGVHAGLKIEGKKDLALIYSQTPCQVAAAFTTNTVKAAPVLYCQKVVQRGTPVHAVVINSGNANACTGDAGLWHVKQEAQAVSQIFGNAADEVLVLSTGVIGVPLPIERIVQGITKAAERVEESAWTDAAQAIITTDTHPKIVSLKSPAGYTITGIAKGSGMISPNMATMLAVVCTDASLSPELMEQVPQIWNQTFNRIVVDGDMSTNDTVLLLANGASGVGVDEEGDFLQICQQVCTQLAMSIVRDGEGATKLVTIRVSGGSSRDAVEKIARAIATSPLCKTTFYGADPNWGRIICAAGYAGADFNPEKSSLFLTNGVQTILLFEHEQGGEYDEAAAIALMETDEWEIHLALGEGESETWLWTCDLSHEYVTINGHYRT